MNEHRIHIHKIRQTFEQQNKILTLTNKYILLSTRYLLLYRRQWVQPYEYW